MNIAKEDISEEDEEINILKWISGSYLEVAWKVEPGNQKFFNIILFSNDLMASEAVSGAEIFFFFWK